jgi:hypothetical protein
MTVSLGFIFVAGITALNFNIDKGGKSHLSTINHQHVSGREVKTFFEPIKSEIVDTAATCDGIVAFRIDPFASA